MKKVVFSVIAFVLILSACSTSDDDGGGTVDNFDRKAMLENLADNIIIPAYQNFSTDVSALKTAASTFVSTTDETNLIALRTAWSEVYVSWQSVSMFEIGKAEELSYRNFINVFPVNVTDIDANIDSGSYDLNAVSEQDEQGLGALDYIINGLSDSDAGIVGFYTDAANGTKYEDYLMALVNRIEALTNEVLTNWTGEFRDAFVNNSGSSATSSVDKIVNDYIFHYEKHLRAGKIGIPAGVFATQTFDDKVEAFYKGDLSKTLFNANLQAMQDFFNGKHFGSSTTGESFKTYLDFLNTIKDGVDLPKIINDQFNLARTTAAALDNNFSTQVRTNNSLMLNTYDELQKNVVHLKVDMVQAFSIRIDFVDADGD
ncbi:imelysin family protein [Aquimarina sp. 2201CG5-10]|uniref:imelysin family protein n=1 Tax=Aquimarina callyspongiae TaxID=3098150 RepID=UPI002AB572AF|nr:imelysin family protein [Aquimarina sp. 2201CG5-10]MDY8137805.1 imelysin family protein [Aquimarina sp. 2201CG5-10]